MEEQLIDYAGALDRLGGDAEFLAELLVEMIVQVDSQFEILKEAVRDHDYKKIHNAAHGLKGAAANLDITRMHHLFRELEEEGHSEKLVNAEKILDMVDQSNKELRTFVENL